MRMRLPWAWYGVLATLVGIGLAHLAASLTDPASSPVLAVGLAVIDLTPTPMKEWAIRTFGSADKVILVGSVMAGVLLLAAVAGVLARWRLAVGAGLLVALVLVAAVAATTRPSASVVDVLPSLVAVVVGPLALVLLARTHEQARTDDGRRTLLLTAVALTAAAAASGLAGRLVTGLRARPEDIALASASGSERNDEDNVVNARAEVVETLGAEIFLHLACGAHTLVARMPVPERMVEVGETVQVEFKMAKTHLFDKTNEVTLV